MDREAAQARLNRIRTFNSELSVLQQDGVVTLDDVQRRAIADYYQQLLADLTARFDLDRDEGQQRMSLGMHIASILGAIRPVGRSLPALLPNMGAPFHNGPGRSPDGCAARVRDTD